MKLITVLLVEDHNMVREGFRLLLKHERDIKVVGEAETGRQAVDLVRKLRPAIVVMDIAMPMLNGLEATRQIRKTFPEVKVLILSAHSDDAYVEHMTELGVAGFLLKQSSSHELVTAIREVQKGNRFFSPAIATRFQQRETKFRERSSQSKKKSNRLSSREMEVLQRIAEGQPNKQVAADLGICLKTVVKHRQNLMSKLDIHNTAGLTRYAISTGIIENSVQVTIV